MADDNQQEVYPNQIARFVQDFLQAKLKLMAMLPKELAQLQDRLGKIHPGGKPHPVANYDLFYRISGILYRKSNLTMGELSSALSVPLSTATRMMDWLVDEGYTRRLPDPEDRRIVRVALTETGRELHQAIEHYAEQRFQQVLSGLTAEERVKLFALVGKVVAALKGIEQ